jgi:cytochrome c5
MSNQDDKVFMKRFSSIIGGLVLFTILIIVIANTEAPAPEEDENPSRISLADERTRPVGAVRTEVPVETAPVAAAPVDPASIDGAAVYATVCQACHMTGAAGAPKPGSDEWALRAAKGEEVLIASVLNGLNAMPPKGGRPDLSDAEIIAAVEHMLAQ